jgi:hypothetical protein
VTNSKDIRNPFLFRKATDIEAEVQSRYYWRTNVEFFQVVAPPKNAVPYILTSDPKNDRVTKLVGLPEGISGKASTDSFQGGPALSEAEAKAHTELAQIHVRF